MEETHLLLIGNLAASTINALLDRYIPYKPLVPNTPLPSQTQTAVTVGSAIIYLVGQFTKNKNIQTIGEGALLYTIPMFMHHVIVKIVAPTYEAK